MELIDIIKSRIAELKNQEGRLYAAGVRILELELILATYLQGKVKPD